MKNSRIKLRLTVFVLLFLFISLGYAFLNTNFNIVGSSTINNPTWDIHFDNVNVDPDSVSGDQVIIPPTINTTKDTVNYNIVLNVPGDFFVFSVDIVNEGTIAGMVNLVTSTINGETIEELPPYLTMEIVYSNMSQINIGDVLYPGDREKVFVVIIYNDDINPSDLPTENQELAVSFSINYVQADETNSSLLNVYSMNSFSGNSISIDPSNGFYDNYNDAISDFGKPSFLRHEYRSNGVVQNAYIGFLLNNNAYYLKTANRSSYGSSENPFYNENKNILNDAFGASNCQEIIDRYTCLDPLSNQTATVSRSGYSYVGDLGAMMWRCAGNNDASFTCDSVENTGVNGESVIYAINTFTSQGISLASIGSTFPTQDNKYLNYNDIIQDPDHQVFIKYYLDESDKIKANYIGFVFNNKVYYISSNPSDWSISIPGKIPSYVIDMLYSNDKFILLYLFGSSNCVEDESGIECTDPITGINAIVSRNLTNVRVSNRKTDGNNIWYCETKINSYSKCWDSGREL